MADARAQITRPISPSKAETTERTNEGTPHYTRTHARTHERTHKRTHKLTKQGTHAHADKCWRVRAACMPHARCQPSPRKKSPRACECACACMHCTCLQYTYTVAPAFQTARSACTALAITLPRAMRMCEVRQLRPPNISHICARFGASDNRGFRQPTASATGTFLGGVLPLVEAS